MPEKPPKLFDKLLTWYCKQVDLEDIQGDLYEVYFQRASVSVRRANWLFAKDVLNLFNPFSKHRQRSTWFSELYHFDFRNQLMVSIRYLKKHPKVNFIKIAGLSTALTAFLYIYYYVSFQQSYDHFHEKKDRIFRVTTAVSSPDMEDETAWSNGFLKDVLMERSTEVEQVVRMLKTETVANIRVAGKSFMEENLFLSDPELFEIFSYELAMGNSATALSNPNSVILTEKTALKYFGDTNAVGKQISINNQTCHVTGVLKDLPGNSDLQFDLVMPLPSPHNDWAFVYILLKPDASIDQLKANFSSLVATHLEEYKNQGIELSYQFEKITNVHFSKPKLYDTPKSNKTQVLLFQGIGYLILFISLINYVNLHTSQLVSNIKGLGIRKIIGASKVHLFLQLLVESFLSFGIAVLLSLGLIVLTKSGMAMHTGFDFFEASLPLAFYIYPLIAFVILIAGSAIHSLIFISKPTRLPVLEVKTNKTFLRKGLIGIQFALSFGLIVTTIAIYQQLTLLQNQNLGFNNNNVLCFQLPIVSNNHINPSGLKKELSRLSSIRSISFLLSNSIPGQDVDVDEYYFEDMELPMLVENIGVDEGFLNILEIPLVSGRFFSSSAANERSPSREVVVNEAFVRKMGWESAEAAIGKAVNGYGLDGAIIGVVQDFYFHSPHRLIQPLVLEHSRNGTFAMVRLHANDNSDEVIDQIRAIWSNYLSEAPFSYSFLKSDYEEQFRHENAAFNVVGSIAILIIALALLGMYAILLMLGSFRTREMGIRKVNGAGRIDIFKLFSKEFASVLLISIVIIAPILWIALYRWLSDYPLRIELSPMVFIFVAIAIFLVMSVVIYLQALRSYGSKTVDALKYE